MPSKQQPVTIALQTLLFSCEHGGHAIPATYLPLFEGQGQLLTSHRGWDIGALEVAKVMSESLNVQLHFATTSRLLVELNRSLHHPNLFSSITQPLSKQEKDKIIETHYLPYRSAFTSKIKNLIANYSEIIHISVHSFTPELAGVVRNADIGLLYDPKRQAEKDFCRQWKQELLKSGTFKVRYNYPYKGTADGFTTYLRKTFPQNYVGIELELNQALLTNKNNKAEVIQCLISSLKALI